MSAVLPVPATKRFGKLRSPAKGENYARLGLTVKPREQKNSPPDQRQTTELARIPSAIRRPPHHR